MRIERLRRTISNGRCRIEADVSLDSTGRSESIYVEVPERFERSLAATPEAFVLAALPRALFEGADRLTVEGALCARLEGGLPALCAHYRSWYGHARSVDVTPLDGYVTTAPHPDAVVGCFQSGGVDALAMLYQNRLDHPLDHPEAIRVGLFVFGLNTHDFPGPDADPARLAAFERHARRLETFAAATGFQLLPVYTNVRRLYRDWSLWDGWAWALGTCFVAHALRERLRRVWLASDGVSPDASPRRAQIRLLPYASTGATELQAAQLSVSRMDKIRLVAGWEEALRVLRVCLYHEIPGDDGVNCGRCEKCVRTMLALAAADVLHRVPTFPHGLSSDLLGALTPVDEEHRQVYRQLVRPLEEAGHVDLARALRARIAEGATSSGSIRRRFGRWLGRS